MSIAKSGGAIPSGGTLELGLSKGFLIITSQSGGWTACYVASFNSIYEVFVDDRARSQSSVAIADGLIVITNTYPGSRNISALLFGYYC